MYSVYKKHRKLKLLGLSLGLLLAWCLAKPAADMIAGQNVQADSLVGSYANTSEHQVTLYEDGVGTMVSNGESIDFFYSYSMGRVDCQSEDGAFQMRVLGNGNLWNCYDRSYLYRRSNI